MLVQAAAVALDAFNIMSSGPKSAYLMYLP